MGRFIVKIKEYYLEWSTVVDAPVSFGESLEDFRDYYQLMYGIDGMMGLDGRLARVEEYGSSGYESRYWPPELFAGNRAGPEESELTEDEIYRAYCLMQPIRNGWIVPHTG